MIKEESELDEQESSFDDQYRISEEALVKTVDQLQNPQALDRILSIPQNQGELEMPSMPTIISPRMSLVSDPAHQDSVREIVSKHYFLILLINDEEQADFEQLILQN